MSDDEQAALLERFRPLVSEFVEAIRLDFRYTERMAREASSRDGQR